ncbi:AraC family transcriptional regulator [Adhaeretor mobilis]|uniref:Xylose operon regulatory protein n=1 Tax=Adhaeretor mobilis TaxID=1930276 RepID=A0A517MWN8_9BACT|nr:xylose operon transcription regulator XylR [Adhaeretor mobilis]QDS99292.1 Xylose operon regulatory protein [Adhaeretor mobilis]
MNNKTRRSIGLLVAPSSENNRGIIQGVLNYIRENPDLKVDQRKALPNLAWKELPEWTGDGLIAMAHTRQYVRMLRRKGLPAVNVSSQVNDSRIPRVHADDHAMGRLAAEEFLAAGLRHFGFVGHMKWPNHENRRVGFSETLAANDFECATINIRMVEWIFEGTEQIEVDIPKLAKRLAKLKTPVGMAAGNDLFAYAISEACKLNKAQVPFDVAIIGNGNLRLVCDSTDPPLSSVAHGAERIGFEAAALLDKMMQGQGNAEQDLVLPPKGIVQRRSTDFFAVEDQLVLKALRLIRSHIGEPFTTIELAHDLAISRRMLTTRFRKALGHSPGEEIRRAKLRKAKDLLTSGNQSVEAVGHACGFENSSGFVRFFRSVMGVPPGQYRRNYLASRDNSAIDKK